VRRACIDIGSNTTRLLVADCEQGANGRIEIVHQERAFTHLGRDRLPNGEIPPATLKAVSAVVGGQLEVARLLGCGDVRAVATAALRRAANGDRLPAVVHEDWGLEVRILTAEEEARLAFIGAARSFPDLSEGELGVVDVGGGSSELVVGKVPTEIRWWTSIPVGSGDLARGYLHSDPPSSAELAAARQTVDSTIGELEIPSPARAAAVGGSAASLARLAGPILDRAAFARSLGQLAAAPSPDVARKFGLDLERVRLLPAGLLILEAISERFRRPLAVAGGGLREGVLMEAARG
jgi:exopolyphosphatase/guanosine-5'-triphosphate,3'-diphosphate pyrophosphatase